MRGAPKFDGFKYTGEVRHPKPGEYFLNPDTGNVHLQGEGSWGPLSPVLMIYKKTVYRPKQPSTADVLKDLQSAVDLNAAAPQMFQSLERYRLERDELGGFLSACLQNDFMEACTRADHYNAQILPLFARYIFNVLPSTAWGSKENVQAWLNG